MNRGWPNGHTVTSHEPSARGSYKTNNFSQHMRVLYFYIQAAKAQTSLHLCEVSSMPLLLIHTMQGCGNTMPDLSDLVPFYSGQVENFYVFKYKLKMLINYYEFTGCIENIVYPDQLAS